MLIEGSQHFSRTLQLANPGPPAACIPAAAASATATAAASAATATAAATAASATTAALVRTNNPVAGSVCASILCGRRETSGVRDERWRPRPLGPECRQQEREAGHREQREHQSRPRRRRCALFLWHRANLQGLGGKWVTKARRA